MPLSEHEQRILAQLEQSLHQADPSFAKNVRDTTVYRHGGRRVRWGVAGFLAGLAFLLATFSINVGFGLIGVAGMFASALVVERNVRLLGRAAAHDFTRSVKDGDDGDENSLRAWLSRHKRPS